MFQKRPDQFHPPVARGRIPPRHPGQACAAGPSQQPQKEKLKLMVGMMCQDNRGDSPPERCARQKIVASVASGHFHGEFVVASKPPDVAPLNHNRQPQADCRPSHEPFVGIAAPPTKLMVQMGDS